MPTSLTSPRLHYGCCPPTMIRFQPLISRKRMMWKRGVLPHTPLTARVQMNFLQQHHLRLIKWSSQALRVRQGCCPAPGRKGCPTITSLVCNQARKSWKTRRKLYLRYPCRCLADPSFPWDVWREAFQNLLTAICSCPALGLSCGVQPRQNFQPGGFTFS